MGRRSPLAPTIARGKDTPHIVQNSRVTLQLPPEVNLEALPVE
jgi:hypothetical protein